MKTIEILSIPKIRHAHCYGAPKYENQFGELPNRLEISYIFDGSLTYVRDGVSMVAERGDILCNMFMGENVCRAADYHCHHTFAVEVDWKYVDDAQGLYLPSVLRHCAETEEIERLIDEIIFSAQTYGQLATRTAAIVLQILCKIDEIARRVDAVAVSECSILSERAKKYIRANITMPLTQTEVARYLGVSAGHLCGVFKKSEGISLIKYVNTVKLKCVYALMKKEGLHLYEAAAAYGYSDPNYVSALYKRMFGKNITDI